MKHHIATTHQHYENEKEEKPKSKRIHCEICGQKFNKEDTFKKHKITNHNIPSQKSNQTITQSNLGRSTIPSENNMKITKNIQEQPRQEKRVP